MTINCFSIETTEETVSSINSDIMGVLGTPGNFWTVLNIWFCYQNLFLSSVRIIKYNCLLRRQQWSCLFSIVIRFGCRYGTVLWFPANISSASVSKYFFSTLSFNLFCFLRYTRRRVSSWIGITHQTEWNQELKKSDRFSKNHNRSIWPRCFCVQSR